MMDRWVSGQEHLFDTFNLGTVVSDNRLLRGVDRCLDMGGLRRHLDQHYNPIGHPFWPRSDDQNACHRLLLRHSFRTAAV